MVPFMHMYPRCMCVGWYPCIKGHIIPFFSSVLDQEVSVWHACMVVPVHTHLHYVPIADAGAACMPRYVLSSAFPGYAGVPAAVHHVLLKPSLSYVL